MTQEILSALRNIEDKIMREPVAFEWTPSMDAIWPADMRPTMSGLLAIWAAMHDAAVYNTNPFSETDKATERLFTARAQYANPTSPKPLADAGWIEWNGGKQPVAGSTRVEVYKANGSTSSDVAAMFRWSHFGQEDDNIAYRLLP